MTFEGQYLTKQEYIVLGGSSTIGDMPFNLLEFEARKQIDLATQRRLVNETTIPNEVKICVYNLINTIQLYINGNNRNKNSETVGSYSVSFANDIKQVVDNKNTELNDIILKDLYGVIVNGEHILYIGVG